MNSSPDFIEAYDDALDPDFCRAFIEKFEASRHKVPGRTGGGVDTTKKISTDLYLNQHPEFKDDLGAILKATTRHAEQYFRKYHFALIAPMALTLADPETGQPIAVTHDNYERVAAPQAQDLMRALYRVGGVQAQKYDRGSGNYNYWHCEVFPEAPANEPLHRTLLFMFYLNDVAEGGHTEFFYQQRAIQPKAGRMVIAPAYFTHTHRGCTPVSGDKYILTSWILLNRAEQLYGQRQMPR
ncbi:2OG-Fe(II) oxygenase [Ideonella sp. DXS29W]|uniref:2OG-Fe(II) oxygenase n=1 Tax=Ideonella lacteola TaxID=2984193 RepID=A0ABU9BQ30_9BURK